MWLKCTGITVFRLNKYLYVGPNYCRAVMYVGRVACCPLASHGEYANGTDEPTDGRTPDRTLHYAGSIIMHQTLFGSQAPGANVRYSSEKCRSLQWY